ncbi:MAG: GNAT family N-acetyltransferase, partial [Anaerolineae bacterium]|nr:GNAT family N-acetyltransferase [Anaerolineae bacterium]
MDDFESNVLASGDRVILRDHLPSDVDCLIRWQTHGEWRKFDAPWEGVIKSMTPKEIVTFRKRFLESCEQELPVPRKRAIIATPENKPLGWVNHHTNERFSDVWSIGIDICEDEFIDQGIGTEALRLWIQYLFTNSNIHRIGLDTWSFNPRMMRVAEK